jgi:hypothetical protein
VFAGRLPRAARPAGAWCGVQGTFAVSGVETPPNWARGRKRAAFKRLLTSPQMSLPSSMGGFEPFSTKLTRPENSFLWRDHRDTQVKLLMERLWNHLTSFQSWRDQPGLAYLMWKTAILPAVLADRLGTSRDNEFAYKFAHKKPTAKPVPATARRAPKRLIWIYREKFSAVASTLLRGHQLAELATQRLEGKVEIGVANETHLGE